MWQSRRWGVFPLPFTSCRAGSAFQNRSSGQCFPTTSKTTMRDFRPGCSSKKKMWIFQTSIYSSFPFMRFFLQKCSMISLKYLASFTEDYCQHCLENLTGHTFGDAKSSLSHWSQNDIGSWPSSYSKKTIEIATSYHYHHYHIQQSQDQYVY